MEIVLVRHGEPEFSAQQGSARVKATDMPGWIAGYDASGIIPEPNCHALLADKRSAFVISSPLPRARASLQAMNLTPDLIADDLREAPLPVFNLPFLRLSPQTWLVLFRLCWLSGALAGPESKKQTMQRAEKMALTLIAQAQQHKRVIGMGHGVINRLIARELEKAGWVKSEHTGNGYWSSVTFTAAGRDHPAA
ncbi:histidine phosphatase family protein [Kosakonia sp. CCTCC M2018092]|uniref:histidine phosphatase family protein n=1 Tax=Kosakonia sp. CCTCC M2018092 TaxID=2492396 RepID=UPI000F60D90B|nr:histidine phosphatase family protein [Kosakonia sp. CCTCC M2018092]AZI88288.1 histidine phosphatase family protein [Kosakonia sp. CCTCC M2018092]